MDSRVGVKKVTFYALFTVLFVSILLKIYPVVCYVWTKLFERIFLGKKNVRNAHEIVQNIFVQSLSSAKLRPDIFVVKFR